jgi:hypothetical protein
MSTNSAVSGQGIFFQVRLMAMLPLPDAVTNAQQLAVAFGAAKGKEQKKGLRTEC